MGGVCSCFEGLSRRRGAPSELRKAAAEGFAGAYGGARPTALGVAPGRAEILGNHTDYNEGYILSAAIDRYVVAAGRALDQGSTCRVASSAFPGVLVEFSAESPEKQTGSKAWANYVLGVVDELRKVGVQVGAFDAFLTSNVPAGAGVSSSAAVEMATAKLLARLFPRTAGSVDDLGLVKVAKAAENNFVGMGCGILDQFSSGRGRAGCLVYLDCRTLDFAYVPFRGAEFVLANTHAPHQLVDGKYGELREHCFAAAAALGVAAGAAISHLRDVSAELFALHQDKLSDQQQRIAKHIVMENERVQAGIKALKAGDMRAMGKLMSESHASSRDDFGNSCPELDKMQACAEGVEGFLGARLMGGGFGGSTISLVEAGKAEAFSQELARRYQAETGIQPTVLVCVPGDGAYSEALA